MKARYDEATIRYMDQLFPKLTGAGCELCGRKGQLVTYQNGQMSVSLAPFTHPLLDLSGRRGANHKLCWECVDTWNSLYPTTSITSQAAKRLRQLNEVTDNVTAIAKLYDKAYWNDVKGKLYIA